MRFFQIFRNFALLLCSLFLRRTALFAQFFYHLGNRYYFYCWTEKVPYLFHRLFLSRFEFGFQLLSFQFPAQREKRSDEQNTCCSFSCWRWYHCSRSIISFSLRCVKDASFIYAKDESKANKYIMTWIGELEWDNIHRTFYLFDDKLKNNLILIVSDNRSTLGVLKCCSALLF